VHRERRLLANEALAGAGPSASSSDPGRLSFAAQSLHSPGCSRTSCVWPCSSAPCEWECEAGEAEEEKEGFEPGRAGAGMNWAVGAIVRRASDCQKNRY
jgi:hypothetical protein